MQVEILFGQRSFKTFIYLKLSHQFIFVHCTFKVCDQEICVFLKEIRKGLRRSSLTIAKYIFYSTFHVFTLCFFLLCSSLHFSIKVILDGIESFPGHSSKGIQS